MSRLVNIFVFSTQGFFLTSNLATLIRMLTLEQFELECHARQFWNPEKECHMEWRY